MMQTELAKAFEAVIVKLSPETRSSTRSPDWLLATASGGAVGFVEELPHPDLTEADENHLSGSHH
jgi:hypothetical protein